MESPPREQHRESPEVHVSGICVDASTGPRRILIARRAPTRLLYPDCWEGCGGQLRRGETFAQGVARHFHGELGIRVDVLAEPHSFYAITEPGTPTIPGLRFLCRQVGTERPVVHAAHHSEVQWVSEDELRALPESELIPTWRADVLALLARASART